MNKLKTVWNNDPCRHVNVDPETHKRICSILKNPCQFKGKTSHCGFRVHYNCLTMIDEPLVATEIKKQMLHTVIENWQKRKRGSRGMTGRPLEDVTSDMLKEKLSYLNVKIIVRKQFTIAPGVTTLADIRIEKPDYPTTIISMKTWIGPGEFRNCLGDAYLTKLMYGMIKMRFYIVTLVPKQVTDQLVEVGKPHIDGLYQLTDGPYIDDLFTKLKEIYGEPVK